MSPSSVLSLVGVCVSTLAIYKVTSSKESRVSAAKITNTSHERLTQVVDIVAGFVQGSCIELEAHDRKDDDGKEKKESDVHLVDDDEDDDDDDDDAAADDVDDGGDDDDDGEQQRAVQQCHIFQPEDRNCDDDSDVDEGDGVYSDQGDDDYPNYDVQQQGTCFILCLIKLLTLKHVDC